MIDENRPKWLDSGRIPSLDGVRAIAVLFVLLAHAHQTHAFPNVAALHALGRVGPIGVDVFFVLSGFLITVLMIREIDRAGRLDLAGFYRRRLLRIVPAYACVLVAVGTLQFAGLAALQRRDWLAALTYTVNFFHRPAWEVGHAWSLSIEEHFYLIWPLAVILVAARHWIRLLVVGCIGCFLARWVVLIVFPAQSEMAELWTFTRLDSIAIGCALAVLAHDAKWRMRLDRLVIWWPAVLSVLIISLCFSQFSAKWSIGVAYSLNAVCIALLVWSAAVRCPSWLNHPFVAALGIGSYSLYLWQQLFLNPRYESWATAYPQNLFLAAAAAWISYRFIESPFLRFKDKPAESSFGVRPPILVTLSVYRERQRVATRSKNR